MAEEVKSRSNGDIIIKIFPASQLFKITETFDAVEEGAVDPGFKVFSVKGVKIPHSLSWIYPMPFLPLKPSGIPAGGA